MSSLRDIIESGEFTLSDIPEKSTCVCACFAFECSGFEYIEIEIYYRNNEFTCIVINDNTYLKRNNDQYVSYSDEYYVPLALSEILEETALPILKNPKYHNTYECEHTCVDHASNALNHLK